MGSETQSFVIALVCSVISVFPQVEFAQEVVPVRNEVARVGQQEVIMMRHAFIEEGEYAFWERESRRKVWPWFQRLGARMIGDFEVIYPEVTDESPGQDEALRFARYASYEHWQATRRANVENPTGGSIVLAGKGNLSVTSDMGLSNRRTVLQGSKEAVFLQGHMAQTRPLYMPGTREAFREAVDSSGDDLPVPVSHKSASPNDEVLILRYRKIKKNAFQELYEIERGDVWPYLEKIGGRPVGQWKVIYLPNGTPIESPEHDEDYSLIRYASLDHYKAVVTDPRALGGDGPDFQRQQEAKSLINELILSTSYRVLKGPLFNSPPVYAQPHDLKYRYSD
jgi:hypothetical protein